MPRFRLRALRFGETSPEPRRRRAAPAGAPVARYHIHTIDPHTGARSTQRAVSSTRADCALVFGGVAASTATMA